MNAYTCKVMLEVLDADGEKRILWESERTCLDGAARMREGKATIAGHPVIVLALVLVR